MDETSGSLSFQNRKPRRGRSHTVAASAAIQGRMSFIPISEGEGLPQPPKQADPSFVPPINTPTDTYTVGNAPNPASQEALPEPKVLKGVDNTIQPHTGSLSLSKRGGRLSFAPKPKLTSEREDGSSNDNVEEDQSQSSPADEDTTPATEDVTSSQAQPAARRGRAATIQRQDTGKLSFAPAGFEPQDAPPRPPRSNFHAKTDSPVDPEMIGPADRDVGLSTAADPSSGKLRFVPKNTIIEPRQARLGESHLAMYAADIKQQIAGGPNLFPSQRKRRTRAATVAVSRPASHSLHSS